MGSESANLVCSPFFPPGILRSQDGEHLCRNDSHTGSGTKQEKGGEGGRGGEAVLTPAGTTCRPLSSGLALTCVGSEPHTDCSPHQVQAVSNQIMHFCCERLTSDHGLSLKFMQCGQFIGCDLDFPAESPARVAFTEGIDCESTCAQLPSCFSIKVLQSPRLHPRPRAGAEHLEA